MKSHPRSPLNRKHAATIAAFGAARLVRNPDGRHELLGGTPEDHADARDWCSLFAPEVVFSHAPRHQPAFTFAA